MSSKHSHVVTQPQLHPPHTVQFCPRCRQFIVADWFIYHQQYCQKYYHQHYHQNNNINNHSNVPVLNKISSSIPSPPSIQNNLNKNKPIRFKTNDIVKLANNVIAIVIHLWNEDQIEVAHPFSTPASQRKHIIVNPTELKLFVPLHQINTPKPTININANKPLKKKRLKKRKHKHKHKHKQKHIGIKTKKTYKGLLQSKLSTSEKDILYLTNQARIDADRGLKLAKSDTKAIIDKLFALEPFKTLPCIHLIDAIVQSVGQPYIQLFEPFIANVMKTAYVTVIHNNIYKKKMQKFNSIWIEQKIFAPAILHKIKMIFEKMDNECSSSNNNIDSNRHKRQLDVEEFEESKSMSLRPHKKRKICCDNDDDDLEVISAKKSIRCPLTLCVMKTPMKSSVCGHVFDRYAIKDYINKMMDSQENKGDVPCPMAGCSCIISMGCLKRDMEMELLIDNGEEMEKKKSVVILELCSDSSDDETQGEDDKDSVHVNQKERLLLVESDGSDSDSDSDIEILPNVV